MPDPEPEPSLQRQLSEAKKSVTHLKEDNGRLEAEVWELRRLVESKGGGVEEGGEWGGSSVWVL